MRRWNGKLTCGLALSGLLTFCALFADFLAPYPYAEQHRDHPFAPPVRVHLADGGRPFVYALQSAGVEQKRYTEDRNQAFPIRFFVEGESYLLLGLIPCRTHLFSVEEPARIFLLGTDALGRDIFSRLLYGARFSLTIAAIALLFSLPLALAIGGIAGFYGGAADFIGMRLIELFLALPALYLIVALRSALPLDIEPAQVFLAMGAVVALFGWASLARIVRGLTLSLREREFVVAATALGASSIRILGRHILPQLAGTALVQASLAAPGFMLAEVTLSYLGLGVPEPLPSWGTMLAGVQSVSLLATYWWNLAPAAALFAASLAFHLLAEGLKETFDPHAQTIESSGNFL
ncbi:MAG: ABC transporter permease [Blastocatellia bacterium]